MGTKENITASFSHELHYAPQGIYGDTVGSFDALAFLKSKMLSNSESVALTYLCNIDKSLYASFADLISYFIQENTPQMNISLQAYKHNLEDSVIIALPSPKKISASCDFAFLNRKSSRKFDMSKTFCSKNLSSVLYYSLGVIREETFTSNGIDMIHPRRTYASGGGLYPVDLYLSIENTENIEDGYYEYIPFQNCLRQLSVNHDIAGDEIKTVNLPTCHIRLFFKLNFETVFRKYADVGLLLALVEIGSII